jgi:hypothetical protein
MSKSRLEVVFRRKNQPTTLVRSNEAIGVSKAFVHIWIQLMPKEVLKKGGRDFQL